MQLSETRFLFLDGQTSGLSTRAAELIELGWSTSLEPTEIETRLLRPTDCASIPKKVWQMTGLTPDALGAGDDAVEVWRNIVDRSRKSAVTAAIIHYSQFELPFLHQLNERAYGEKEPFPWPVLCTYRIAGRLYADLPARTLRALSGHFGLVLPEGHRAREHVAATQRIWSYLVARLKEREMVATWNELGAWLTLPTRKRKKRPRQYLVSKSARLDLPNRPGVYEMHASDGKILYIGKATSLHSRVNSYFRQRRRTRTMLAELMTQVAEVKVTATESALEAALLENDRIKAVEPPYNYSLRAHARRIVFASRSLDDFSPTRDSAHPVGPLLSDGAFDTLERLCHVARNELDPLDELYLGHPVEAMQSALKEILLLSDESRPTAAQLYLSAKRLPADKAGANEAEASLLRKLRRAVRCVHQARWICWLMSARVSWPVAGDPEGRTRFLVIREGKIAETGFLPAGAAMPSFVRERDPLSRRQERVDLATYDRMRILGTELCLLVTRGAPVTVELSSKRAFRSDTAAGAAWFERVLKPERSPAE